MKFARWSDDFPLQPYEALPLYLDNKHDYSITVCRSSWECDICKQGSTGLIQINNGDFSGHHFHPDCLRKLADAAEEAIKQYPPGEPEATS